MVTVPKIGPTRLGTAPLLITGAQKGGTTSLAGWLAASRKVVELGAVECLAFDGRSHALRTRWAQGMAARLAERGSLTLLKRAELLHHPVLLRRAADAFPGAIAIAILRHPVDRTISAWSQYRRMGIIGLDVDLEACLRAWERSGAHTVLGQLVEYSRYSVGVEGMLASFANAHVCFADDVTANPKQALSAVLDELPELDDLSDTLPLLNAGAAGSRLGVLGSRVSGRISFRWSKRDGYLVPRDVGWRIGLAWRAVRSVAAPGHAMADPPVPAEVRAAVLEAVGPDLCRLEEVLGRAVPTGWRQP